ncbi:hydrogenase iron-sulfur subunit [Archaeoglobus veneficus]|uniref:Methyl-viologen-reducing hydrogenase delta subunit n=1 Tax=Archaeoglobus veneficus (strain DSM 11195 / SNP6) TaxID=693661 RepID=F2KSM7_ARCVS|nr:hydrogenase iron-sulfur subunit [Archaeoglobus veneficus]AEA48097.1 methyl-viologen-reducing hydrogenase delta subunit [Archaeoglobus veneficus SNP6]
MPESEPKVVAFLCRWCAYAGADTAGISRMKYPANVRPIRVMCSGRVDTIHVLYALRKGADCVLVAGCHPGDCYYMKGNLYMRRRMALLRNLLEFVGIEPERLQVSWVSAGEAKKFSEVAEHVVDVAKQLGKSRLKAEWEEGQ